jgi:hypothetical protein
MERASRELLVVCAAILLAAALAREARGQSRSGTALCAFPFSGRLSFSLDGDSLESRLISGSSGSDFAGFSFLADDEAAVIRGAFRREGKVELAGLGRPFLAAGPGSSAGALRMLSDPLSFSVLSAQAVPVSVAPDLESGTVVLCVGTVGEDRAGNLDGADGGGTAASPARAAFLTTYALASAAADSANAGLLLRRGQLKDGDDHPSFEPSSAAAGIGFGVADGEGSWSALGAASLRRARAGGGGWEPDPPPDPAGLVLHGALLRERRTMSTRTLVGFAASLGRLEGPGLAVRLEAEAREGPLLVRIAAARAGSGFRELAGTEPERGLSLASDLRLALRRASALALALRLESPRRRAGSPPLFGGSARLAWTLPVYARDRLRSFEPRLEFSRKAGAAAEGRLGFALKGLRGGTGTNFDLSLGLDERHGLTGAEAAFESSIRDEASGLELGFELGLDWLEDGDPSAPVIAEAALRLDLPLPDASPASAKGAIGFGQGLPARASASARGADLRIEVGCPEGGIVLAPRVPANAWPGFVWSIRYVRAL